MDYLNDLNFAIPIVLIMIGGWMTVRHPGVKRWEWLLLTSVIFLPFSLVIHLVLTNLSWIVPFKYDQYVFVIDEAFGSPSFHMGRFLLQHRWLANTAEAAYDLMPSALWILAAVYFWTRPLEDVLEFIWTNLLNCCLAVLLYIVVPVSGPLYAFSTFPQAIPAHVVPHPVYLLAPPNGVPSVHLATALLILHFGRRWRVGTLFASLYLMLTIISTLGFGEHYLFDLLVAIPFAMLVLWLGSKQGMARAASPSPELSANLTIQPESQN
jgi:hypothetical protein